MPKSDIQPKKAAKIMALLHNITRFKVALWPSS